MNSSSQKQADPGHGEMSWAHVLDSLTNNNELSESQVFFAIKQIIEGKASAAQVGAFAATLRLKGESEAEIAAIVAATLEGATTFSMPGTVMDMVGTGGDGFHTVNISTMAAIVAASLEIPILKHGNRAASSQCGTADVLEELGIPLEIPPEVVIRSVEEAGIGFCFAPIYHAGLRFAAQARKDIGIRTFFNILGPLVNPAQPQVSVVGCADSGRAELMAQVMAARGVTGFVVTAADGLDEFTTTASNIIYLMYRKSVQRFNFDTASIDLDRIDVADLRGGDARFNAQIVRDVLSGSGSKAITEIVAANSGLADVAWQLHHGTIESNRFQDIESNAFFGDYFSKVLWSSVEKSLDSIYSGKSAAVLEKWLTIR